MLPFPGTHTDWTLFRYSTEQFYDTRTDSTIFPVLAWILPFFGTRTDWTLFRFSPEQFFDTRTDSTFSRHSPVFYHFSELPVNGPFSVLTRTIFRYSHGFYLFQVLARILPFFGTQPNSFSKLAQILPFPGTRPYSTIFRNSQ